MWKDWLSFSRREQYGIFVLAGLIVFLAATRILLPLFLEEPEINYTVSLEDEIIAKSKESERTSGESTPNDKRYSFSSFNPNRVSVTKLHEMGLPSYVIVNWMKFLEAGGKFYSPEDIKKVYGIDDRLATKMAQHVKFDTNEHIASREINSKTNTQSRSKTHKENAIYPVESTDNSEHSMNDLKDDSASIVKIFVNQADEREFRQIPGIGEVYSKRIIAFRELLGGFYDVAQLKEVYGISGELFNEIQPYLTIKKEELSLKKIEVNNSSLRQLKSHPYINFYQARDIIEYRRKKGHIKSRSDLKSLGSFDDESLKKIVPYLSFSSLTEEEKQNFDN